MLYKTGPPESNFTEINETEFGNSNQTANSTSSSYSFTFQEPGVYYYATATSLDLLQVLHNKIIVTDLKSSLRKVDVYVRNFSATLPSLSGTQIITSCYLTLAAEQDNITEVNNCSIPMSPLAQYVLYSVCSTPVVTAVVPKQGVVGQTIFNIQGSGFGMTPNGNIVKFGPLLCTIVNSTDKAINCITEVNDTSKAILTAWTNYSLSLQVVESNKGFPVIENLTQADIQIVPHIIEVVPSFGSLEGGTSVVITGSTFTLGNEVAVGFPCRLTSIKHNELICTTLPIEGNREDKTYNISICIVRNGRELCTAESGFSFTFSRDHTPNVTSVMSLMATDSMSTTLIIQGERFSSMVNGNQIQIQNQNCTITAFNQTFIVCSLPALPASVYQLTFTVCNSSSNKCLGNVQIHSDFRNISVQGLLTKVSPSTGSIYGGTLVTLEGIGFHRGIFPLVLNITIGDSNCHVRSINSSRVTCLTSPQSANIGVPQDIQVVVDGLDFLSMNVSYTYLQEASPTVTAVSPNSGQLNDQVNITGNFINGSDFKSVTLEIGSSTCEVSAATKTWISCNLGVNFAGIHPISVTIQPYGFARSTATFEYQLRIYNLSVTEGSFAGGNKVTIYGAGFNPSSTFILICRKICGQTSQLATDTQIECIVPKANTTTEPYLSCSVEIQSLGKSATLQNSYNYSLHLTPTVDGVNRTRGGTAGGSPIQITGSGFTSTAQVTIAGTNCTVVEQNDTAIHCVTGASSRTIRSRVMVLIVGKGFALTDVTFWYVDLWSSPFTWKNLTLPVEGDFVVVPKGQTLVLDLKTPILSLILVQGGELIFDKEAKDNQVALRTQRLLIVSNGRLEIGTEESPFLAKTEIVLYGHRRSTELPLFGTKNIALREGEIVVFGQPINVTWSKLISTVSTGETALYLRDWVPWEVGGKIVIASTSYSQRENEVREIKSIRSGQRGSILELTVAVEYEHISVLQTIASRAIDTSAEVGYLTRNILFRGNVNEEWSESIQACSEDFRTGQFEVQTCFQGRFGSEQGSDQFGGHIMIHAAVPSKNNVRAQLAYAEFTHFGQAFRLGRYPIHFHLSGNVSGSYVRGCAIYNTFNRAVTIHAVDYLLVENNVAYNILGHAYFFEDGNEQQNTLQGNLGVFVQASSSLLNVDITPATFWVVNANNIIRNNAAAGGTHFGFWYRIPVNPTGPSFTSSMCPQKQRVLEFSDNTAHSFGWYGLWVFPEYTPTVSGSCGDNVHAPSYYDRLLAWKNDRGMEAAHSGSIQVRDSIMLDNKLAGVEYADMASSVWGENGPLIADTLIVGHSQISEGICTESGIKTPASYYLTVSNVTFVNFDQHNCSAIQACAQCKLLQGGFETRYEKITFENVTNITQWKWEHEHIHRDMDGSLTRTGQPSLLIPTSGLLDPRKCMHHSESSLNIQGSICNGGSVIFGRIGITNPTPSSLQFTDLNITNQFGISKLPYIRKRIIGEPGYMALVEANISTDNGYLLTWIDGRFHTNISYIISTTGLNSDDYIIMSQNYPQPLDVFELQGVNSSRKLSSLDDLLSASTGDYVLYNNKTSLSYVIKGSQSTTFKTYKCFYNDCIVPSAPVVTPPAPPERSNNSLLWSMNSSWPNNLVPQDGQDCLLNDVYMQLDVAHIVCNKLEIVEATLEVLDGNDRIIEATYIIIRGGRLVAGYPETPFQSKLKIVLQGNSNSPELRVGSSPPIGGRSIAVFGELILNASPRVGRTWTMLSKTTNEGTSSISLIDSVDWLEGDQIVITSTSYNPYHSEILTIKSVSANKKVLEVNDSLMYTHIGKKDALDYFGAEVGLLTRSIVIENGNPLVAVQQSFGCQVLVTQSFPNLGHALLNGVEFSGCGHLGLIDDFNPRFALAFLNLQQPGAASNVTECSFHSGYNTAIGVLNSNNILIKDNVIHGTVGPSMKLKGNGLQVTQNMASLAQYIGVFQKSQRLYDPTWTANYEIETLSTSDLVFEFNNAAGGAMACFHIDGEDCIESSLVMRNNIGHSCLHGIHLGYADGRPSKCSKFENFVIYSCYHYGFFSYSQSSIEINNLVFINNKAAVYVSVVGPSSLTHEVGEKYVAIQNSVVVSTLNSTVRCIANHSTNVVPPIVAYQHSSGIISPSRGHVGIIIPSFVSGQGHFPTAPWHSITSYPAINGSTSVTNVTFMNFESHCNSRKDVLFITNPSSEDANHPVYTARISSTNGSCKIYLHRPKIARANPSDCVDMYCDGMKNAFLKDTDGTLAGFNSPRTIIPLAELSWDGADRRAGIGDYRIPVEMLTNPDGSRISVNASYPLKGIVRGDSFGRADECSFMTEWNAYLCSKLNHLMLVMESLDADTEVRRLSPIAYGANGFVSLVNGPMDNGWCGGYTCQERISTFYLLVASGFNYTIALTSTIPQNMALHLLHADNSEVITVAIIYSNPQRLDVHVSENGVDKYVTPNNAYMDGDDLKYRPGDAGFFVPSIADPHGSNFYDRDAKLLHITLRGKIAINIATTPVIMVSLLVSVSVNDFFNEESLIRNLAFHLGIPNSKIRLVSVSRETSSRRKKRQVSSSATVTTVVYEIGDSPQLNETNKTDFASLSSMTEDIVNVVQAGLLNATIASFSLSRPVPPPVDPTGGVRATQVTGGPQPDQVPAGSTIMTYYAKQLMREAEERMAASSLENFPVPCRLEILNLAFLGIFEGTPLPLTATPNVSMLSCDGSLSTKLGLNTPWMLSVTANRKPERAFLSNTNANFSEGHAYFHYLIFSHPGSYALKFSVSHPTISTIALQSPNTITVQERQLRLIIIQQPGPGNITFPLYPYVKVQLVDTSNNNLMVHNHTWRNTMWYVSASVVGSDQTPVQVPLVNGAAIFNFIQVYSAGNYHLKITTFQTYGGTVVDSEKHKVLTSNFSVVTVPILLFLYTYNVNYRVIFGNIKDFLRAFNNEFRNQYNTLELINSTVNNENIIISVYVTSRDRNSLVRARDDIYQGKNPVVSFVFIGMTFTPVTVEVDRSVMLDSESGSNNLVIALSVTFGVLLILAITSSLIIVLFVYLYHHGGKQSQVSHSRVRIAVRYAISIHLCNIAYNY